MGKKVVRDDAAIAWDLKATEVFFKVMKAQEELNADDVWREARAQLIPPQEMSKRMAPFFKRYTAAMYLKKTGRYKTSERNDSSPLPVYTSTIFGK